MMRLLTLIAVISLPVCAGFNILTNCQGGWNYGDATHIRTTDDGSGSGLYTNLVAWYMFDSTNSPCAKWGTNAVDYSVSNSPATVFVGTSSGATWIASSGPTSSYYSFGATQYIPLTTNFKTNSPWSICLWIYGAEYAQYQRAYQFPIAESRISPYFNDASTLFFLMYKKRFTMSVIPTGSWYHMTVTYNGSQIEQPTNFNFYFNGSKKSYTTATYSPVATAGGLCYGNAAMTFLDDFRIYNKALSATEVTNIFNATKAVHPNPAW